MTCLHTDIELSHVLFVHYWKLMNTAAILGYGEPSIILNNDLETMHYFLSPDFAKVSDMPWIITGNFQFKVQYKVVVPMYCIMTKNIG